MSLASSSLPLLAQDAPPHITRPSANFPPSFWGDTFLHYHSDSLVLSFLHLQFFTFIHSHTYYLLYTLINFNDIGKYWMSVNAEFETLFTNKLQDFFLQSWTYKIYFQINERERETIDNIFQLFFYCVTLHVHSSVPLNFKSSLQIFFPPTECRKSMTIRSNNFKRKRKK